MFKKRKGKSKGKSKGNSITRNHVREIFQLLSPTCQYQKFSIQYMQTDDQIITKRPAWIYKKNMPKDKHEILNFAFNKKNPTKNKKK